MQKMRFLPLLFLAGCSPMKGSDNMMASVLILSFFLLGMRRV